MPIDIGKDHKLKIINEWTIRFISSIVNEEVTLPVSKSYIVVSKRLDSDHTELVTLLTTARTIESYVDQIYEQVGDIVWGQIRNI